MLSYILPFIVLIVVVVFIHEYGHYYFAKRFGVGVTDFSIGFGKEMFGWNDKSGTRWKVCVIPSLWLACLMYLLILNRVKRSVLLENRVLENRFLRCH